MSDFAARPAKPKKDSTLTMRLTRETRQALEERAAQEGRSVSELAERWLDQARIAQASVDELLGGAGVADAVKAMVAFAKRVQTEVGSPNEDYIAREALKEGWRHLLEVSLPFTPGTPAMAEWFQLDQVTIPSLAAEAAKAIRLLPATDAVRVSAEAKRTRTTYPTPNAFDQPPGLSFGAPVPAPVEEVVGPSLIEDLDEASHPFKAPWGIRDRVAELVGMGGSAAGELNALMDALDRQRLCREQISSEQELAVQKGRALVGTVGAIGSVARLPQLKSRP